MNRIKPPEWLVRQAEFKGFSCDEALLGIYMEAALAEQEEPEQDLLHERPRRCLVARVGDGDLRRRS